MIGVAVLSLPTSVQATDSSCAPSPAAGQAVLALGRSAGLRADRPSQMLERLSASRWIAPKTVTLVRAALAERRMFTVTYQLFVADLADGPARTPTPQQAAQTLVRRGSVLPLQACLTVSELRALLEGERTALDDSYRTLAARTRP
jgi:predicted RNA-binding Zn ribbon-like protein